MRIIAGRKRGQTLKSPETFATRPTPARVREALFSILGDLKGAVVVDGFGGTGALGCEALSRGADFCYFIERNNAAADLITENIARVDATANATVLRGRFERQLGHISRDPDLWLLDPPYNKELGLAALLAMRDARCVTDATLVVLEQQVDEASIEVEGFALEDTRTYGQTRLCFFRRQLAPQPLDEPTA